jgi:hypothetical protein
MIARASKATYCIFLLYCLPLIDWIVSETRNILLGFHLLPVTLPDRFLVSGSRIFYIALLGIAPTLICSFRIFCHDVFELRPQRFYRAELISYLEKVSNTTQALVVGNSQL